MQAGESESIQNQKLILQKYADEHHFFNTRFFVDDGFSGVSFEREGLQAMLHEVEAGKNTPKGIDPEASSSSGNAQGIEYGGMPPVSSVGFDIKLTF